MLVSQIIRADFMEDSPKPLSEPDTKPISRLLRWPRGQSIADIIRDSQAPPPGSNPQQNIPKQFGGEHFPQRGWEPGKCPGGYRWDKTTRRCVPSSRKGTSGVPRDWESDPQFAGNPNIYKRIMNRCPPGFISNEKGNCIPDTNLRRKQRERKNRTTPSRLKDKESV